jgi:transcriptional regulator with XRE-family HTH domain
MSETYSLSEYVTAEIRAMMARRRVSGRQLAATLGVSQTWMSTRLAGSTPIDLNDLDKMARALNVEVVDLLPPSREGRTVVIAGADRRQTTVPQLTGSPIGHPKRVATGPATRRPVRTGA